MRHLIYFSKTAATSGKALSGGNLMKAGRMDIAIHSLIQGIFLSNDFRRDTVMHLVFYGMPDPPKHIEIRVNDETPISKKDVANLIKKLLYKCRAGEKREIMPGCFVEKKDLTEVVEEIREKGSEIFILDKNGESLREAKIKDNPAFILGDHEGLPRKELKGIKKFAKKISVGPHMYFASQTVAIVNNELDIRGI
jgi:tRNA (pseudouridine54-N1)-methyltransferase